VLTRYLFAPPGDGCALQRLLSMLVRSNTEVVRHAPYFTRRRWSPPGESPWAPRLSRFSFFSTYLDGKNGHSRKGPSVARLEVLDLCDDEASGSSSCQTAFWASRTDTCQAWPS